jgi:hypothetical protein
MHFRRDFQAQAVQVNDWIFLGCCVFSHRLVLGGGQLFLKIHDLLDLGEERVADIRQVVNPWPDFINDKFPAGGRRVHLDTVLNWGLESPRNPQAGNARTLRVICAVQLTRR